MLEHLFKYSFKEFRIQLFIDIRNSTKRHLHDYKSLPIKAQGPLQGVEFCEMLLIRTNENPIFEAKFQERTFSINEIITFGTKEIRTLQDTGIPRKIQFWYSKVVYDFTATLTIETFRSSWHKVHWAHAHCRVDVSQDIFNR